VIRLSFRTAAEDSERVLGALLEIAPAGLEHVEGEGWVEFALYGTPGELPSFPEGPAEVAGAQVVVRGEPVPDDWAERWKRFHVPVLVGGRLWVRPPWEQEAVRPGVDEVVIDPGRAFGTGTHPTTRLCLELMLDLEPEGSFADLGCGSGVLAIAAAKLGFAPVRAYDSDRAAVEATRVNARENGVVLDVVERFDLRRERPPTAGTVAANLMRPLLLSVRSALAEPPPRAILSGLLEHEADELSAAWAPMEERRRLTDRGWSALLLATPAPR
jgi:ribosomal protein L11 methyltransferase